MKAFFFLALFSFAEKVFAADTGGTAPPSGSITLANPLSCTSTTNSSGAPIFCLLEKILLFLYNLAIPITVIMVLVGGFQILTAAGDPEKFSTGRKTILYAAGGFAVVVLANSVIAIIQSILK